MDPCWQALRLQELAERHGILLRIFGGVAVRLTCPSAFSPTLARTPRDIDCVTEPDAFMAAIALYEREGYKADRTPAFPDVRLLFPPTYGRPVELYAGCIPFGCGLDLSAAFQSAGPAVPPAVLLAAKLLRPSLRHGDLADLAALVLDHPWSTAGTDRRILRTMAAQHPDMPSLFAEGLEHVSAFAREVLSAPLIRQIEAGITALNAALTEGELL